MHNFINIRPGLFPESCPPLPIHRVIHFQVGTIKYIALGGGRFGRRNEHTIALCVYENHKIIVRSWLKNKHFGNITDMTYYCDNQNETVLVSACEQQKITLWNINRKECSNEYFGEYYIWGKITSIDTYYDNYDDSRRIIFGSQDQNVRILHVGIKECIIINTIEVGRRFNRLSQNNDVLVKIIKRMNENFLAATNNDNEILIWKLSYPYFVVEDGRIRNYYASGCYGIISGHGGRITSLQVIHNGHGPKATYLVSSSEDRTLRIWHIPEFNEIKRISCGNIINDFAFAKVGDLQYIYTIHYNKYIMIWSEHTEFLLEELHFRGMFNKKRPNRKIIDSKQKQHKKRPNRKIIDSKQKQHILPLDVLSVIKSFMGCNY